MPKKDTKTESADRNRGFYDLIGFVLVMSALALCLALISFDKWDLAMHTTHPNHPAHNWIGPMGAQVANGFFAAFGVGAYIVPILLVLFSLGCVIQALSRMRTRWLWAGVLFLCCVGFFDLYTDGDMLKQLARNPEAAGAGFFLERTAFNLAAPSAGGVVGHFLNQFVFGYFGRPGATIVYATLYFVSLLFLSSFQLGHWIRRLFTREPIVTEEGAPQEQELEKKARVLGQQVKQLEEEVARRTNLGADLQPVPKPIVRDLSVPQPAKGGRGKSTDGKPAEAEPAKELPGHEGEVIPAREVRAATTDEVLGRPAAAGSKSDESPAGEKSSAKTTESAPTAKGKAAGPGAAAEGSAPATGANTPPAAPPRIFDNSVRSRGPARKKPLTVSIGPKIGDYKLPPMDVLQMPDMTVKPTETKEELMANARLMQQTLAQFGIEVTPGDITKGPTITRYELHPAPGVKLEKIQSLGNNLAAALKAERISILTPIPGKNTVGVEVPNAIKTKVIMRDILESEEWNKTKARIPLALGKDVYGHPIIADLAEMPHLLIAGATGSGKSVCINSVVASLLYRFPPDKLRFVMIDPKVVELQHYNVLPHLVVPVITDPKKVILALRWVITEMEKRYQIFAKVGVRNIKSFNERPRSKPTPPPKQEDLPLTAKKEKVELDSGGFAVELDEDIVVPRDDDIVIPDFLSYIVVIIDELADLMLVAPADVEMAIARITQMARAAGIHCIVATQRPSVDVITGVIKANIPARIAFQVASRVDSRTILDAMGADKLLGKGDMLYLPPASARLIRAQGALNTDQELQSIVDFIAKQGKPSYEMEIHEQLSQAAGPAGQSGSTEDEEVIQQCIEVIRSEQKASVSLLQRRLRLGYGRAARIMDELEQRGIVGPSKGAEPRDILIDLDGGGADGGGQEAV